MKVASGVALEDARKRGAVLCIAVITFCAVVYQVTVLCLAWHWGYSGELSQQVRGANLTPGNAEAWDRIGEGLAANFDAQPAGAISFFERAVKLNPRSARDWMDLAQAYEVNGNAPQANAAYEQAQRDYPISAEVSWKYGNFLMRQGQTSEGLKEVHRALVTDPSLVPLAISRIWSLDPDVHVILHDVLPQGQQARLQALDFFAARHEEAAALETWEEIAAFAKTKPIDIHDVFAFMQDLISSDQAAEAERIWREALAASHWPDSEMTGGSQIWNGGFEEPIVNGGLDWRFEQVPGAYVSVDSNVHHSGEKSLRVDFTGGVNLDFWNVHQIVPVEPSTHYVFQYFMRTQSISTESGMRFEILDLNDNEVNLMTPDLTGTNPWTPVRMDVATGRNTHFLDIRLRRLPSRLFDNKLGGTVWVDDVSLSQKPATGPESHP
ncbi:MAG: tetratricopeptide repeat protein [Candidatus Acidiferrales bacterium]